MYPVHHVAVTVSDFDKSLRFYEKLGFVTLAKRHIPEKNKKVALMQIGDSKLELFWYKDFKDLTESREEMGNNVHEVGAKHFALRVSSIEEARKDLLRKGITWMSEPTTGDTGYDFFYIKDPDGIWIEFVQDDLYP